MAEDIPSPTARDVSGAAGPQPDPGTAVLPYAATAAVDAAAAGRATKPAPRPRVRIAIPYLVLAGTLLLTAVAAWFVANMVKARHERDRTRHRYALRDEARQTRDALAGRLEAYVGLLRGASGLFAAADDVSREEFRAYVDRLNLPRHYPGARGVGFIRRLKPGQVDDVVMAMQDGGEADFRVWAEPGAPAERPEYHCVVYLEPREDARNRGALGYDMFSEPTRRAAMESARDTGEPAASGKASLKQQPGTVDPHPGFHIYVPVYRGGVVPGTKEQRRTDLRGFVYSPFRCGDLLSGILGGGGGGEGDDTNGSARVDFAVFDGEAATPAALLYDSAPGRNFVDVVVDDDDDAFFAIPPDQVDVAGRRWTVTFRPHAPAPAARRDAVRAALVPATVLGGTAISLLLFVLTRAQARARLAAEHAADDVRRSQEELQRSNASLGGANASLQAANAALRESRSRLEHVNESLQGANTSLETANASLRASEERFRQVRDSGMLAIAFFDLTGRITSANDAFLSLVGYAKDDLSADGDGGGLHWDKLTPEGSSARATEGFARLCERGRWEPHETEFVRKDGSRFWGLFGAAMLGGCDPPGDREAVAFVLDVTARRNAEDAVRRSGHKLRVVTDALPVLIAYLDTEQRYRFNNKGYEQWFGIPVGELVGKHVRDVLGPEVYQWRREHLDAAFAGRAVRFEAPTPHRDGRVRDTEVAYIPDLAADGRVQGVVVLGSDVTDRKRGERALRRYADLFEHAELGLAVVAADGQSIEMANPAVTRLHGCSPAEFAGMRLTDLFAPEYRTEVPSHLRLAAERGHHTFESQMRRCDGAADFPAELNVTAVRNPEGDVQYYVISAADITERERAESELRASEARKGAILDTALDGIITMDDRGVVVEFNPAAEKIFGYGRSDAVGRPVAELIIPPALREAHHRGLARYFETGEGPVLGRRIEVVAQRAGGEEFPAELAIAPITGAGPSSPGTAGRAMFTAHVRDITARKSDERDREQLLASERAARAQAEASAAEAARANRTKDEFLATLSHELRTPLNAILGWAQLLRTGHADEEDVAMGLETIERNARAQAQLVEDLLDLSRIISGKLRLDVREVHLPTVINAALDSVRPAADAKGIQLLPVFDNHAGMMRGDPDRVQQIVWNLLSNAIKFTPSGGQVQLWLTRTGSDGQGAPPSAEISVSDTGQGIKPEFLPYVFERLRQADASTTRRYGGLGLGLAIVRHLVELHGGTVRAESPGEGRGATFTVTLPLLAGASSSAAAGLSGPVENSSGSQAAAAGTLPAGGDEAAGPAPRLDGVRVLFVDDEPDARDLVARLLRQFGAEVTTAATARHALDEVARRPPDVLVSDIGMPDEDGYWLIRQVRALPAGDVPAAAHTAFAREDDARQALAAGYQVHVPKPVDSTVLAEVVNRLAARRTPVDETFADASAEPSTGRP